MTGLELAALAVGSTAGTALGIRSWRRNAEQRKTPETSEYEPPPDLMDRQESDMILGVFERLANEGSVTAATLGRARFLHDVVNHAGSISERTAASRQLLAMFEASAVDGTESKD